MTRPRPKRPDVLIATAAPVVDRSLDTMSLAQTSGPTSASRRGSWAAPHHSATCFNSAGVNWASNPSARADKTIR